MQRNKNIKKNVVSSLARFGQIKSDANSFTYHLQGKLMVANYTSKRYKIYMKIPQYQYFQTISLLPL